MSTQTVTAQAFSDTCAGYLIIRPDLGDKRGLSCCFTLTISREQQDRQNPSLVGRAHKTLDKTGYFSLNHRRSFRSNPQPNRAGCRKCIVAPVIDRVESTGQATSVDQP
jgi:hypothetical protein